MAIKQTRPVDRKAVIAVAVGIDLCFGELPNQLHPVALVGRLIGTLARRAVTEDHRCPPGEELRRGIAVSVLTIGAALASTMLFLRLAWSLPTLFRTLALGLALKQCLSVRALFTAVGDVQRALAANDLAAGRATLSRIVSRNVTGLDRSLLAAGAIESLSENLSDSVIAPCLAYWVGGLLAAAAYRTINTLDAMLGYRDWREYVGKAAAKLDDYVNFVPARLTAAALILASPVVGGHPLRVWAAARREQRKTASPNAGWPMAVTAVALGRCLEKRGTYRLYPAGAARHGRRTLGAPDVSPWQRSYSAADCPSCRDGCVLSE